MILDLKFRGIDGWNRPVFKVISEKYKSLYFGDINKLWDYDTLVTTINEYYKEHFKVDNPNIKIINDLKNIGAKFIACGQAMAFFNIKKEDLLPQIKVSLTAQTVLTRHGLLRRRWSHCDRRLSPFK